MSSHILNDESQEHVWTYHTGIQDWELSIRLVLEIKNVDKHSFVIFLFKNQSHYFIATPHICKLFE